uniref:non-specific serine/threonine protein kinase n=1 Tax=Phallusia mammillata TaxID=59560 RepID=A0A6F9DMR9_9ASCI|nr:serine/threonine-protein kinase Nek3-like [Phallusia mammillata]
MDEYEIVTKIGKGSSGSVFLARSKKLKKLVAIKKIEIDESRRSRCRKSVMREANILRTLNHFHIVKCYEWFLDDEAGNISMALEYCNGGTIQDRIKAAQVRKETIPEEKVMLWTTQITSAVNYIHDRRILHRDLKSENVFLIKSEDVKLGDFGISKEIDHTLDKASTCVGTPCYLSPELCQDIPYSFKSDIWALGCLIFEMLALSPAFDAANLVSLFYKIVNCKYATLPVHCSSAAKELISKVLTRNPADRPNASQLLKIPILQKYTSRIRTPSPQLTKSPTVPPLPLQNDSLTDSQQLDDIDDLLRSADGLLASPELDSVRESCTQRSISVYGEYNMDKANDHTEDNENFRPQSCPHSANRRSVNVSTYDSVATWSGYGDRGSRRPSGKHYDLDLSSSSEDDSDPKPLKEDSESDNENIITQRDYYSDGFSSSDDEKVMDKTVGDDEIPEIIEVNDESGVSLPAVQKPQKTEVPTITPVRNLPGSNWLISKRAQVLRRKQDDVRNSLPVIAGSVKKISMDQNSNRMSLNVHSLQRQNQNHKVPGGTWPKKEALGSSENKIIGKPLPLPEGVKKKRKLPGSGWLLGKEKQQPLLLGDPQGIRNQMRKGDYQKNAVTEKESMGDFDMSYDEEYPDDFEDDSDDSGSEFNSTTTMTNQVSSLDLVKKECIDAIGEEKYEQLKSMFKRGLSIGDVYEKCRKEVDFETLETCYLLLN